MLELVLRTEPRVEDIESIREIVVSTGFFPAPVEPVMACT